MAASVSLRAQNGEVLFSQAWTMESFFERARGLIGNTAPDPSQAWVFERCGSIHTCFMSAAIDVVETDGSGRVISVRRIPPWRIPRMSPQTEHVIETAAGSAQKAGIEPGTTLTWR